MKIQESKLFDGMVWCTLPLVGGLYYWEHTLRLVTSGHQLVETLLVPVILGWAYYWNMRAEYARLRQRLEDRSAEKTLHYRLVTPDFHAGEPCPGAPDSIDQPRNAPRDESQNPCVPGETHYLFEVRHHVSNI